MFDTKDGNVNNKNDLQLPAINGEINLFNNVSLDDVKTPEP